VRGGLLPGALLPNTSLRFVCRQVELEVVNASTAWTRACERGDGCRSPPSTRPAATGRPTRARRARGQRPGRAALRAGTNFNGSARDIAGVCNAAGNVLGLMPHPSTRSTR
jgi:phosphoribosylformylglycinamidine synthase